MRLDISWEEERGNPCVHIADTRLSVEPTQGSAGPCYDPANQMTRSSFRDRFPSAYGFLVYRTQGNALEVRFMTARPSSAIVIFTMHANLNMHNVADAHNGRD